MICLQMSALTERSSGSPRARGQLEAEGGSHPDLLTTRPVFCWLICKDAVGLGLGIFAVYICYFAQRSLAEAAMKSSE